MKAILILSGGLDSTTLAYKLKKNGYELYCITFNYGQKQSREIDYAKNTTLSLNAKHQIIDISFLKHLFLSSSLTNNSINIPHGEYSPQNMASTVVPNRNAILLAIAWALACEEKADIVAYGAQKSDNIVYPDTRPEFFDAINHAFTLGTEGCGKENLVLCAPFINKTKGEVIKIAYDLGIPFTNTYSCYEGNEIHCGQCGACTNRKNGFINAQIEDPTNYLK